MNKIIQTRTPHAVISKAIVLLEENAEELVEAFQTSDGNFLAEDSDVQNQICEILQIVKELKVLQGSFLQLNQLIGPH